MLKITIYSTHTCPYCKMLKDYLSQKNIAFDNVFVDDNQAKAEEMMKISGQMGVPFTVIEKDDGTKQNILGFDRSKIDQALGVS